MHDDLRFAGVVLCVEHLVRNAAFAQQSGEVLRGLDGRGAHQHRLAAFTAVLDVLDNGLELLVLGQIHEIGPVLADHGHMGRDDHDLEPIDLLKLRGLGIRRTGHAGELLVEAEIVLESDGGQGLVLVLDRHSFLGFHRLMQPLRPAPAGHGSSGELVDNDHLAITNDVIDVPGEQRVGAQTRVEMMHQHDVAGVVQAFSRLQHARFLEQLFHPLMAFLGEINLPRFLVYGEVAGTVFDFLPLEFRNQAVDADV